MKRVQSISKLISIVVASASLLLLSFLTATPVPRAFQTDTVPDNGTFVLAHVTVIDMTGAAPKPDMNVVVTGNRIVAIGRAGQITIPENSRLVDATGKFLIPGLWDMHVHLNYERTSEVETSLFPLLVANGITGVRDMWDLHAIDGMRQIHKWRSRIASGELLGPRIAAVARGIDGPAGGTAYIRVNNERDARAAVQSIKRRGYDFIKVYSHLSRETYFAIVDEAKRQAIPFAGHVPFAISAAEASEAGQRSIEHLSETIISSSSREEELRKAVLQFVRQIEALKGKSMTPELMEENQLLNARQIDSYSEEKAAALYARFARNSTYHCPTLVIYKMWASVDDPNVFDDPRLRYVPVRKRKSDKPYLDNMRAWDTKEVASRRRLYQIRLRQVAAMQRAGVPIIAGTDFAGSYPLPGFSLHDELEQLVLAGLTPMEALRTASYNPAKYFGLLPSFGTIESGKIADMVLLDANPLENIRNTRRINAVIVNGRYLSSEELQKLLAAIETAGNKR